MAGRLDERIFRETVVRISKGLPMGRGWTVRERVDGRWRDVPDFRWWRLPAQERGMWVDRPQIYCRSALATVRRL